MDVLGRLQRGIERLYRVDTGLGIHDFVIDADTRQKLHPARMPREQVFFAQGDDGVAIAVFVDPTALANLARHDPSQQLSERNLGDFLLAIEGVSHFVYMAVRAHADRPVSALELELQAEIDKYITCLLILDGGPAHSHRLRRRLFFEFAYEPDLDDEERQRYAAANHNAHQYTASLERRFVRGRRIAAMLAELRRFYRLSLSDKLAFIAQAA